jgi:hypothetical protein
MPAPAGAVNEPEFKALGLLEVKDDERGEVEAIVATLGVVDRDGEVITAGAIKNGSKVKLSSYGHDIVFMSQAPVGKGALKVEGDKVVFRGSFFMTTQRGVEAFRTLKELGEDQEWSFGFKVMGSEMPDEEWTKKGAWRILTKLDSFEVSPVLRGAGIGTGTREVKAGGDRDADARTLALAFARISERAATPAGLPLPAQFVPALRFAADRLAMSPSQIPLVKMVAPGALGDGAVGCFVFKSKEIHLVAGRSDEETLATLFHEMVHRYEDLKNWLPDERFASGMEEELLAQWAYEWRH